MGDSEAGSGGGGGGGGAPFIPRTWIPHCNLTLAPGWPVETGRRVSFGQEKECFAIYKLINSN